MTWSVRHICHFVPPLSFLDCPVNPRKPISIILSASASIVNSSNQTNIMMIQTHHLKIQWSCSQSKICYHPSLCPALVSSSHLWEWNPKILIVYWIVMKNKSSELTRLDWVGIRLNQFEMFEEHENCLSRWKQCGFKFETVLNENHV